ncbi:DUF2059 domain-containing protein [Cereibacter sp. SYSU M97828]|nr:DUF2059 domain-containing protein [Cereibacter flavus]
MLRAFFTALVLAVPIPAMAQETARALSDAMMIPEIVAVMREEGLESGAMIQDELMGGRGGDRWPQMLERIYDVDRARQEFDEAFAKELEGQDALASEMLAFMTTEPGRDIVRLEIEARRALIDDAAEDAAKLRVQEMTEQSDPRLDVLRQFAEVNQLVEMNVAGALNTNLAFYEGLAKSGALPGLTQEQMLDDVRAQEPTIRAETEDWLYPYLALAYGPLPDTDLDSYLAFSESEAGQRLNGAVFAAFDQVFARISRDVGEAAGMFMQGEDI